MADEKKDLKNPAWTCSGAEMNEPLDKLTVGSVFKLECSGEFQEYSRQDLSINLDKESEYKIHLLEVLSDSPTSLSAAVTGYKVGSLDGVKFQWQDGAGVSWPAKIQGIEIKSVLDPQKGPPQPFGPLGPIHASLDWWYYTFLISLGVILFGFVLRQIFRILRRKNFYINYNIEPESAWIRALGLKSSKGILDTSRDRHFFIEFNKSARELTKRMPSKGELEKEEILKFCKDLKKDLDHYYTQMFWVPAERLSVSGLLAEIRKQDRRFYQRHAAEIRRVKSEIDRSVEEPEKMSSYDCQQLVQMSRKAAGLIYNYKKSGAGL